MKACYTVELRRIQLPRTRVNGVLKDAACVHTAASRLGGEQCLHDLLVVFVEGEMSFARIQVQLACWYPLSQMLRVVRRHQDIGFSMVDSHVDPAELIETERPWSYLAQIVVYPAYRTLSHGFLKRLDKKHSNVWPLEHLPIDFGKLVRKLCQAPLGILAYRLSCFTERRGQIAR
jgi:hypothetical protein